MKPKHRFTSEQARACGWKRARQHADERRANPSQAERAARELLTRLGATWQAEVEISHPNGMPQWIDILVEQPTRLAIEVDGSHGWHGWNGKDTYGKMSFYDELKARWCESHSLPLIKINTTRDGWEERIKQCLEN